MTPPQRERILNFEISKTENGELELPQVFVDLLVTSRTNYEWPSGAGVQDSQKRIWELENRIKEFRVDLTVTKSKKIVEEVSLWAGNNKKAQDKISKATPATQNIFLKVLQNIHKKDQIKKNLNTLSSLPGLRLVIASKIFRFCAPEIGASIDRHASYFFNSLSLTSSTMNEFCTNFKREWSTGKHNTSRLAIYQKGSHEHNLSEYCEKFLPLVQEIADALNSKNIFYFCHATRTNRPWRACDIEMATYYWWGCHGPR